MRISSLQLLQGYISLHRGMERCRVNPDGSFRSGNRDLYAAWLKSKVERGPDAVLNCSHGLSWMEELCFAPVAVRIPDAVLTHDNWAGIGLVIAGVNAPVAVVVS